MNMIDLAFKQKLDKILEDYKKNLRHGSMAKTLARIRVRQLCKEYGKEFSEVWKE